MQVEFHSVWRPSWAELRPVSAGATQPASSYELRTQTQRAAERLAGAAHDIAALTAGSMGARAHTAALWSNTQLGLGTDQTTASLRSSSEVRTSGTSYTSQPGWTGSSSAGPQLSGTYTGTADDRYSFTVTQAGGSNKLTVTNQAGQTLTTLNIPSNQLSTIRAVADGLSISFTAGSFSVGDTFGVDVRATTVTALDPGAAIGGSASAGFDLGESVHAGSFTVNGVVINVAASDSVNDVLSRITASAAGVDAAYDAATDEVTLTARNPGSAGTVVLAGDTSGVLSALKLDDGIAVVGHDADAERPMADVARFGSVHAGTLSVNGVGVAFDPAVDSLRDVLQRITDQTAVDATLGSGDQLVLLQARQKGATLTLDDGTTGVLDALAIDRRTVAGSTGKALSGHQRRALAERLAAIRTELSSLWSLGASSSVGDVRRSMAEAFAAMAAPDRALLGDLIGVQLSGTTLQFQNRSAADIEQTLGRLGTGAVRSLKASTGGRNGLTASLLSLSRLVRLDLQLLGD